MVTEEKSSQDNSKLIRDVGKELVAFLVQKLGSTFEVYHPNGVNEISDLNSSRITHSLTRLVSGSGKDKMTYFVNVSGSTVHVYTKADEYSYGADGKENQRSDSPCSYDIFIVVSKK